MTISELAYYVWMMIFYRDVDPRTSQQIFWHCAACLHTDPNTTALEAACSLPPTYDETVVRAYFLWQKEQQQSYYVPDMQNALANWEQAAAEAYYVRQQHLGCVE